MHNYEGKYAREKNSTEEKFTFVNTFSSLRINCAKPVVIARLKIIRFSHASIHLWIHLLR